MKSSLCLFICGVAWLGVALADDTAGQAERFAALERIVGGDGDPPVPQPAGNWTCKKTTSCTEEFAAGALCGSGGVPKTWVVGQGGMPDCPPGTNPETGDPMAHVELCPKPGEKCKVGNAEKHKRICTNPPEEACDPNQAQVCGEVKMGACSVTRSMQNGKLTCTAGDCTSAGTADKIPCPSTTTCAPG